MDKVRRELEDKYLVDSFEARLSTNNANGDDDIFNNIPALYMLGEFEYKKANKNKLVANPAHSCTPACRLIQNEAIVYRSVCNDDWYTDEHGRTVSIHLCFPNSCEHLVYNHRCEEQDEGLCPHSHRYEQLDTRRLSNFWTCTQTGNVHICGEMCDRSTIISAIEADYICSLTGQVTSRNIVPVEYHPNQQLLIAAGNEADPLLTATGLAHALHTKGLRRLISASSRGLSSTVPIWDRTTDIALYHICVAAVCEQLFFSEERQMMEAENYLQAYERAYEEVVKALRVRKMVDGVSSDLAEFASTLLEAQRIADPEGGLTFEHRHLLHVVKIPAVLAMFQFRRPINTYFHNVPIMPAVNMYMRDRLRVIDSKFASMGGSNRTHQVSSRREDIEEIRRRRDVLLRQGVRNFRDRNEIPPRTVTRWDSPEWKTRMQNIKDIFSHCLVRVWINMTKYNSLCGAGVGVNLGFKRCLLALLYMTRNTMSISEDIIFPDTAEQAAEVPMVTVIPRIDFAMLLPPENQLGRFKLAAYSNNSLSRRLTTTQTEIKDCIDLISRKGYLNNIQLRMVDVCAEIVKKNQNKV